MNKPYIVCHMISSLDGRIDCAMTEKLKGVDEYYQTLKELNTPTILSGKITAELEMADNGYFNPKSNDTLNSENFSKKVSTNGYNVVVDTQGSLLWNKNTINDKPLLIVTSEKVNIEYLTYLDEKDISWIACGKKSINLNRTCDIMVKEFGIERMAIVGGGHINAGFLDANLLDEVSLLIGAGIDGREGMASVFDGLSSESEPVALQLINVNTYKDDAVWLRYKVI